SSESKNFKTKQLRLIVVLDITSMVHLKISQHYTGDIVIDLAQFHPNFEEENPGCGQGPLTSLPLPPTSREDLWFDGYLEYPQTAKALYTDKRSCLLGDLNPGAMAKQSASLTIEPDERYCKNLKV
ncbi:uncharacterized protein TNCV_3338861, partial [Trichonephila clavipes]